MAESKDTALSRRNAPIQPAELRERPQYPVPPLPAPARQLRTGHACDRCRTLRSKCSGGVRCSSCTSHDAVCTYSDRKSEKNKRSLTRYAARIRELSEEKTALVKALRAIVDTSEIGSEQRQDLSRLLSQVSPETPAENAIAGALSMRRRHSSPDLDLSTDDQAFLKTGEKDVMSDVASPGHLGELQYVVHLNHGAGMTGYIGKMSEMAWLERVRAYLFPSRSATGSDQTPAQVDLHSAQATDMTYFMDDENVLSIDEEDVVANYLPSREVALILTEAYFHSVQGVFQIIQRENLFSIIDNVFATTEHRSWAQRRSLGLVNMVWTVGAKWLQLTELGQHPWLEDPLIYYARARAHGLDHRILFDHPDVEMTQAISILGFYLLTNGSIQRSVRQSFVLQQLEMEIDPFRAWTVIGHAIRHAIALGLHLTVLPGVVNETEFAKRAHLWYSLFQLETLLSEMTGRSKSIRTAEVTLPISSTESGQKASAPSDEKLASSVSQINSKSAWQSFLGLNRAVAFNLSGGDILWDRFVPVGGRISPRHFTARIELSAISDEIAITLYSSSTTLTWFEHQNATRIVIEKLQRWHDSLDVDLDINYSGQNDLDPRSRLELAIHYQSIRMILFRPFLCQISIVDESLESIHFNTICARACTQAALSMIKKLPDDPVPNQILQVVPWWSLLHYVCQAAAILLLELCLDMQRIQGELDIIVSSVKKAIKYLSALAPNSKSAYKAWNIICALFKRALVPYQTSVLFDIPDDTHRPKEWDANDAAILEIMIRTLR